MDSIAVKLFSGGDVRRTRVGNSAPFADVLAAAQAAYGTAGTLSWKDEDDDWVNIRGDSDWNECAASSPAGKVVRVHFFPDAAEQQAAATTTATVPAPEPTLTPTPKPTPAPAPAPAVEIEVVDGRAPTPEDQRLPEGSTHVLGEIEIETPAPAKDDATTAPAAAATSKPAPPPAVHYGVECDVSGENPIAGRRFHLIGHNYDLNEAEFNKLPEEHQALYEVIDRPGAVPKNHSSKQGVENDAERDAVASAQAAITEALEQSGLIAHPMIAAHLGMLPHVLQHVVGQAQQAQAHCHAFRQGCGVGDERVHVAAGEVLPAGPAQRGSFGPGVVQIQHTLIRLGAMPASAIRCRAGFYGRHTAEAIRQLRLKEGVPGTEEEAGTYTEAVRAKLLAHLELQNQANAEAEASKAAGSTPVPAPPALNRHVVREGSPYPVVLDEHEAIVRAWYGNPSHAFEAAHGRDVTAQANGPDAPSLVASNDVWGDSAVGIRKSLIVETETPAAAAATAVAQPSDAAPAPAAESSSSPGAHPEKWAAELQTLTAMGFLDLEENTRLLELHNGAMQFVIGGLV